MLSRSRNATPHGQRRAANDDQNDTADDIDHGGPAVVKRPEGSNEYETAEHREKMEARWASRCELTRFWRLVIG